MRAHLPHTDGLLAAVHVLAADDGVSAGARGDGAFDARVLGSEAGEVIREEGAGGEIWVSWVVLRWVWL